MPPSKKYFTDDASDGEEDGRNSASGSRQPLLPQNAPQNTPQSSGSDSSADGGLRLRIEEVDAEPRSSIRAPEFLLNNADTHSELDRQTRLTNRYFEYASPSSRLSRHTAAGHRPPRRDSTIPTEKSLIKKVAKGIWFAFESDPVFSKRLETRIEQLLAEGHRKGVQYVRKDHNVVHAVESDFLRRCETEWMFGQLDEALRNEPDYNRWVGLLQGDIDQVRQAVNEFLHSQSFDILVQDAVKSYEIVETPFVSCPEDEVQPPLPVWKRCLRCCFGVYWTMRSIWRMYRLGIPSVRSKGFLWFILQVSLASIVGVLDGLFPLILGWASNLAADAAAGMYGWGIAGEDTKEVGPAAEGLEPTGGMTVFWICVVFFVFNVAKVFLRLIANYFAFKMMVICRINITNLLHDMYLDDANKMYYVINDLDHRLDNCDSRISNDVDLMLQYTQEFFFGGILNPMNGIVYSIVASLTSLALLWYQSYQISPAYQWFPVACSVGLWFVSLIPSAISSIWLTNAQNKQQQFESDLRTAHTNVVTHAESIAFYGGERSELLGLEKKRLRIGKNLGKFALAKLVIDFLLMFFRQLNKFYAALIYCIFNSIAGADVSMMTGTVKSIETLIKALMDCTKQMLDFAKCVAFNQRVSRLLEVMNHFRAVHDEKMRRAEQQAASGENTSMTAIENVANAEQQERQAAELTDHDKKKSKTQQKDRFTDVVPVGEEPFLVAKNLDIFTPAGDRKLVGNINLKLTHGESLLIMGPSGAGKSSILRVLGKLWPSYRAHGGPGVDPYLGRPEDRNMFFMGQKPYMIEGTLREQIAYPVWDDSVLDLLTDDKVEALFKKCNLSMLWRTRKGDLDSQGVIWANVLSLGEQQRLQFCRLLWHHQWHLGHGDVNQGFYAVLDEATAALDTESEMLVYKAIKATGMSFLSVAHRPTVIQYHTKVLCLSLDEHRVVLHEMKLGADLAAEYALKVRAASSNDALSGDGSASPLSSSPAGSPTAAAVTAGSPVAAAGSFSRVPSLYPNRPGGSNDMLVARAVSQRASAPTNSLHQQQLAAQEQRQQPDGEEYDLDSENLDPMIMFRNPAGAQALMRRQNWGAHQPKSDATIQRLNRQLQVVLAKQYVDETERNDGYSDSDDDENVVAKRLLVAEREKPLVDTCYSANVENEDASMATSLDRMWVMFRASYNTLWGQAFFWFVVVINCATAIVEAVGVMSVLKKIFTNIEKGTIEFGGVMEVIWVTAAFAGGKALIYFAVYHFLIVGRMRILRLMQEMYMNSQVKLFLVLNNLDRRLDTVDQRMTTDMDLAFQYSFEFFFGGVLTLEGGLVYNVCLFVATTIVVLQDLQTKGGGLGIDTAMWVPLVPCISIGFFILTIIPQLLVSRRVSSTQERQQQYEAEFRVSHARLRTHCEGVAFYGGGDTEHAILTRRFAPVWKNQYLFARRKVWMDLSIVLYNYGIYIVSNCIAIVVCAEANPDARITAWHKGRTGQKEKVGANDVLIKPMSWTAARAKTRGELLGFLNVFVGMLANAMRALQMATSSMLDFSKSLAFAKRVVRLGEVMTEFLKLEDTAHPEAPPTPQIEEAEFHAPTLLCCYRKKSRVREKNPGNYGKVLIGPRVDLKHVDIYSPDGMRCLLKDVNLTMAAGDSVLIMGPSGIGKSSILRVLGELWPLFKSPDGPGAEPSIVRPEGLFFLAQRPYMIEGSLRDQVAYPVWEDSLKDELTDDILAQILDEVALSTIFATRKRDIDRQDVKWSQVLSLGEQQRLQFARLLWHHRWWCQRKDPTQFVAVLDEATAALDIESEMAVYRALRSRNVDFLSVAHRPTVVQFHTRVMVFKQSANGKKVTYDIRPSSDMVEEVAHSMTDELVKQQKLESRVPDKNLAANLGQLRSQSFCAGVLPPNYQEGALPPQHPSLRRAQSNRTRKLSNRARSGGLTPIPAHSSTDSVDQTPAMTPQLSSGSRQPSGSRSAHRRDKKSPSREKRQQKDDDASG